ncbi:hypothetical protein ONZ45_g18197 [Pleurotus djamor]|nr:hypothetical protein ONZ45_g18197 [Pleurotus djamor]
MTSTPHAGQGDPHEDIDNLRDYALDVRIPPSSNGYRVFIRGHEDQLGVTVVLRQETPTPTPSTPPRHSPPSTTRSHAKPSDDRDQHRPPFQGATPNLSQSHTPSIKRAEASSLKGKTKLKSDDEPPIIIGGGYSSDSNSSTVSSLVEPLPASDPAPIYPKPPAKHFAKPKASTPVPPNRSHTAPQSGPSNLARVDQPYIPYHRRIAPSDIHLERAYAVPTALRARYPPTSEPRACPRWYALVKGHELGVFYDAW